MRTADCLDDQQLDDYLNRAPGDRNGNVTEEHLCRCLRCRRRLVERYDSALDERVNHRVPPELVEQVSGLWEDRDRRLSPAGRWKLRGVAAVAALLTFALTATLVRVRRQPRDRREPLRQGALAARGPRLIAPRPDAIVGPANVALRWSAGRDAYRYTVVLMNEKGDVVLKTDTSLLHLLVDERLAAEGTYFWYVSARSRYGEARDSEIRSFRVLLRSPP